MSTPNYLDMDDNEVMQMTSQAAAEQSAGPTAEEQESQGAAEEAAAATTPQVTEPTGDPAPVNPPAQDEPAAAVDEPNPLAVADDAPLSPVVTEPVKTEDPTPPKAAEGNPEGEPAKVAADDAAKPADNAPKVPTAEDHKSFYDRILGQPIKANGKEIQLRSPEEAERLIQMGLNYTKKMQAWQPRMRVVTMLENNGLLDEAKLSHLIDLSKGDPLAIQKLLADSKFDPMTVDADKAASYKPGNHQVSDTEMAFNAALDELESSETGVQLITEVAKQWDEQSRQAVYRDPGILRVINEQKALGLYARITAEMEHLKSLGHLQGVPFLQAYKAVGDMLNDQGRLKPEPQKQVAPAAPVEVRVAAPAPKVTNGAKAAAASPTKATPVTANQEPNYLDIPDEEFLRTMRGRV